MKHDTVSTEPTSPAPVPPYRRVPEPAPVAAPEATDVGDPSSFQFLYSSHGCAVLAMEIAGIGCLIRVTAWQGGTGTESLTFVPGVKIVDDVNGGHKLRAIA